MIADIFYPISNVTITVLAYFTRKKNCSGALHPCLHQDITLGPLGAYSSSHTPSCNRFWLCQNRCTHIFSVLSLDDISYFPQISKKKLEFTSEVWVFSLFCEFQHLIDCIFADNFCVS